MTEAEAPTRPVRWGVLSTANIGVKLVLPAIAASQNGQLVALASRNVSRAEAVAATYRSVKVYGSYEALLEDPDVEAVYIPLPNSLHREWTIRAAQAGKHVLCEKPLGVTADEVREMIEACRERSVLLMEAFMYRFHPQIVWAREQLGAGAIGPVRLVRSAFAFDIRARPGDIRLRAALAGGSLMDVGCYPLSFCRMIFGGEPRDIVARVDVPAGAEVETTTAAVLDFGEGRMGVIDSSFVQPPHQFAEVVGEHGRLLIPRPFTPGITEAVVRIEREREVVERRSAPADAYQLEVEYFGRCIRSGEPQTFISAGDSLEQARSIDRIYTAAGYRWPR